LAGWLAKISLKRREGDRPRRDPGAGRRALAQRAVAAEVVWTVVMMAAKSVTRCILHGPSSITGNLPAGNALSISRAVTHDRAEGSAVSMAGSDETGSIPPIHNPLLWAAAIYILAFPVCSGERDRSCGYRRLLRGTYDKATSAAPTDDERFAFTVTGILFSQRRRRFFTFSGDRR
jgi:hypothetical protein